MAFDPGAFLGAQDQAAPQVASQTQSNEPTDFDPDQFSQEASQQLYGSPSQQAGAFVEGAGRGLVGPLAPAAERLLGVKPEDIRGREQANPWSSGLGEATGLGAGLVTDFGLGPVMSKAGEAVAGLTSAGKAVEAAKDANVAASWGARVGSSAIQQATEMAVLSGSDEIAKQIIQDPDASAQSAIANIGLSAALGGAAGAFITGAVSPLWKATVGDRLESTLSALSSKLGGVDGAPNTAYELANRAQLQVDPVIAAKINGDPFAEQAFSKLSQRDSTIAGRAVQDKLNNFTTDVANGMGDTFGASPEYVDNLESKLDKYTQGTQLADTLHNELKQVIDPISKEYDQINEQFRNTPISEINKKQVADQIAQKSLDQGWAKSDSNAQINLMNNTLEKLPEQQTAEDLKKYITNLGNNHPWGSPTYRAAKDIADILKESQERAVIDGITASGGNTADANQALLNYQDLKGRYSQLKDLIDNINQHTSVGRYSGPQSFLNKLEEMGKTNPEALINRLSGTTKADALQVMKQFPQSAANIQKYHVDNLLSSAKDINGNLNPRKFIKQFNKLSPQVQDFIANDAQKNRLDALSQLIQKTNDSTHNWNNTARTIDKLTAGNPTALTMLAAFMGYGGDAILAHLGKLGMNEGMDGMRYGMMKWLGSNKPIEAEGFKAMTQYLNNVVKGEKLLNKSTESLLKTGGATILPFKTPATADLAKLDKLVADHQDNPNKINEISNGQTGYYLPAHQVALTQSSVQAMTYLQKIKPQPYQPGPLDKPVQPSAAQQARYDRALSIAQQPMTVLQHCKDGTLQATDLQDLQAMYPALLPKMINKITNQLVVSKDDNKLIPYKTKMCLSMLLGQPIDSSMQPMNIQAAQPQPAAPMQPQGPKKGKSGSPSKLGTKSNKMYQTPNQSAEEDAANRD